MPLESRAHALGLRRNPSEMLLNELVEMTRTHDRGRVGTAFGSQPATQPPSRAASPPQLAPDSSAPSPSTPPRPASPGAHPVRDAEVLPECKTDVDKIMFLIQEQQRKQAVPSDSEDSKDLPFSCNVEGCGKRFKQRAHLLTHARSHTGERPYVCPYAGCRRWFSQRCNMRTHVRSHTGERPYKCSVCQKGFSQQGNMRHHMLIHYNSSPLYCKIDGCTKRFNQLGNLKTHHNNTHKDALNKYMARLQEGVTIDQLPASERELFEYFCKLYKNSNRGIRGRGKGTKTICEKAVDEPGSAGHSPPPMLKNPLSTVSSTASMNSMLNAGVSNLTMGVMNDENLDLVEPKLEVPTSLDPEDANSQRVQASQMNQMGTVNQMGQLNQMGTVNQMGQMNPLTQMGQMNQIGQMNQMGQMGQRNQMGQMNQMNQMSQMNQMDQMNQFGQGNQMLQMNQMNTDSQTGPANGPGSMFGSTGYGPGGLAASVRASPNGSANGSATGQTSPLSSVNGSIGPSSPLMGPNSPNAPPQGSAGPLSALNAGRTAAMPPLYLDSALAQSAAPLPRDLTFASELELSNLNNLNTLSVLNMIDNQNMVNPLDGAPSDPGAYVSGKYNQITGDLFADLRTQCLAAKPRVCISLASLDLDTPRPPPGMFALMESHAPMLAMAPNGPGNAPNTMLGGQNAPNGMPNGIPNGMSNGMPNGMLPGMPGDAPNGPIGMLGSASNGMPNGIPNGMPGGEPNGFGTIPNGLSNAMVPGAMSMQMQNPQNIQTVPGNLGAPPFNLNASMPNISNLNDTQAVARVQSLQNLPSAPFTSHPGQSQANYPKSMQHRPVNVSNNPPEDLPLTIPGTMKGSDVF